MRYIRILSVSIIMIIIANIIPAGAYIYAAELPVETYHGLSYSENVLSNINFSDIAALRDDAWPKAAIYEMAALDILKGYGDRTFKRLEPVSKEQAIALVYRIAGREADAQRAGEELETARNEDDKLKNAIRVWSDGYLSLAADEELITQVELQEALDPDQDPDGFLRDAPATREEVARWITMVLNIEPDYDQQVIFNSYRDWQNADVLKIPYIEAALKARIMNGMDGGYFYPLNAITRQEMAQVLKNAESYAFPILNLQRRFGVVEDINHSNVQASNKVTESKRLGIRMSDGKLHDIVTVRVYNSGGNREETSPGKVINEYNDIVVYKNGRIGNSDMLEEGDNIEFIADENKNVRFLKVIDSSVKPAYVAAKIKSVDAENSLITVDQLSYTVDTDSIVTPEDMNNYVSENAIREVTFAVSSNAGIIIDRRPSTLDRLVSGRYVMLTTRSGIVTSIRTAEFDIGVEKDVAGGIVEDNNPSLGYISLYSEDGATDSQRLRIYYYSSDTEELDIVRDGRRVDISDIKPGDTVFLKVDADENVLAISAKNNYIYKYAKVITKFSNRINVEYDDGTQQTLEVGNNLLIVKDRKATQYSELKNGDRIKVLLDEPAGNKGLRQLTIESSGQYISNVYKAQIAYIDDMTDRLVWENVERLEEDKWVKEDTKGVFDIQISDDCRIIYDNRQVGVGDMNKYMKGYPVYVAAEKDNGGKERAVFISVSNEEDKELAPVDDYIDMVYEGTRDISTAKSINTYKYTNGSIIIKEGRLVTGSSIAQDDPVVLVASRSDKTGDLVASVVNISGKEELGTIMIYRGRIAEIEDNVEFTVESYATLGKVSWKTVASKKTFKLSYNTRILGDDGPVSVRDFVSYGSDSYKGTSVYIVMKDSEPVLISTAPYASVSFRGQVLSVDSTGNGTADTSGFTLFKAKIYDNDNGRWKDCDDVQINIAENAIIIKGQNVASAKDIKKGSTIRVLKRNTDLTGDGYVIFIE